jgi:hypothetical protein
MNWNRIKRKILTQKSFINDDGNECKEVCLGKVADLTPSGQHHDFGRHGRSLEHTGSYKSYVKLKTDNELGAVLRKDSDWLNDLMAQAKKHDIYIRISNDKERTFINAGINMDDLKRKRSKKRK